MDPHSPDQAASVRIAVISTPRSGNTWLRRLLVIGYGLDEVAVHSPQDVPALPPSRVALQIHWDNAADLEPYLEEHQFRVVTIARHPFDVLMSILHFSQHEPETSRWLNRDHTSRLVGANPTSPEFRAFASGPDARRLLSVTPHWWHRPGVTGVTYEDLVADTRPVMERVAANLGLEPASAADASAAVDAGSFAHFAAMPNHHGWQGSPGLWRSLITADLAAELAEVHQDALAVGGYDATGDPELRVADVIRRWDELRVG